MKKLIYIICLFSFINSLKSQTDLVKSKSSTPNIVAPQSYNLGLYGNYPIDYSTGVPKIEIPIYTIKSGGLTLPISLSYHASGIKVQQESTSIGLGWVLNAGGMISRQVRDIPDETLALGFIVSGNSIPVFNDIYNIGVQTITAGTYANNDLLKSFFGTLTPMGGGNEWHKDKYPDIFTILTNAGLSGEFSYNNNGEIVSTLVDKQRIICDFENNKITVIDIEGTQYIFGKNDNGGEAFDYYDGIKEISYDINQGESSATPLSKIPHSKTWYLTEVIASNKRDKISFIYDESTTSSKDLTSQSKGWAIGMDPLVSEGWVKVPETKSFLVSETVRTRTLRKIIFKEGWVEFVPVYDRQDTMPSNNPTPRTTEINIYTNNHLVEKVVLDNNYYFNRNGQSTFPSHLKDLKLKNIKVLNSIGSELFRYCFEYDESVSLPEKKSISRDFWGYYNGKLNMTLIPDEIVVNPVFVNKYNFTNIKRESNFDYMKAFSLKKIIYPTKGYSLYDYEPNYFLKKTQQIGYQEVNNSELLYAIDNASLCRETEEFMGVKSLTKKNINLGNIVDGYISLTAFFSDYQFTNGQPMYIKITGLPEYPAGLMITHEPQNMQNFKAITQNISVQSNSTISVEVNTNQVKGNSQYGPCGNPFISLSISYKSIEQVYGPDEIIATQAGGLRVAKITDYDSNGNITSTKLYKYGTKVQNNIGVGEIISNPFEIESYFQKIWPVIVCTSSGGYYTTHDVLVLSSNPVMELGYNNGNPVFYNNVTEYSENFLTKSKIRTDFFYEKPGTDIISSGDIYMNSPTIINPSWKRSYLSKKIIYKGELTSQPVKKEEYSYNDSQEQHIRTLNLLEIGPEPNSINFGFMSCNINNYIPGFDKRFKVFNDYTSIGRRILSQRKVTDYFYQNNKDSISITNNYFYNNVSHNQLSEEKNLYADGSIINKTYQYSHEKGNQYLIDKNMVGVPLQKTITKTVNGVTKIISDEEIMYPNSQTQANTLVSGLPLPISAISKDLLGNISTELTYDKYDGTNGNLQQYTLKSGIPVAIIWGYNNTQPIAKIEGATYDAISGLISSIVNESNNDALQGTSTSENALISALDLFRTNSAFSNYQITTYTYNPLIGVTSITPPSGIREIYKYDSSNRLQSVVDINGNILKEYSYQYKQQ